MESVPPSIHLNNTQKTAKMNNEQKNLCICFATSNRAVSLVFAWLPKKISIEIYVLCLLGLCFDCGEEYKVFMLLFVVLYDVIIVIAINMIQTEEYFYEQEI